MRKGKIFFTATTFVFLVGIYPVMAILGNNVSEVNIQVVFRPLLLSLLFSSVVGAVIFVFARDAAKTALLTGLALILFFSYGHLYYLVEGFKIGSSIIGRHRYLVLLYLSLYTVIGYGIISRKQSPVGILQIFNVMAAALIVFPIFQIGSYQVRDAIAESRAMKEAEPKAQSQTPIPAGQDFPDIYYIILDTYARDDVLKQDMGFDNSAFLDDLIQLGFYIGECSQSNYGQTQLSLASSLNMNYLTELGSFAPDSTDRTALDNLIEYSAVRANLESRGYRTVSLSAYEPLKIESAAVSISTDPKEISGDLGSATINEFEALFIKSTALRALIDRPQLRHLEIVRMINYPYRDHIIQQRFILKTLKEIPDIPGPKFVFVHIQIPHAPLVFGPEGQVVDDPPPFPSDPARPVPPERAKQLFSDQVAFINREIMEVLPAILDHPGPRPVIIIQGDHGPNVSMRTAVLNAYYLPVDVQAHLYPKITPVNTFRLIMDYMFGTKLGLLKDASYNSSYEKPYLYEEMEETRDICISGP